MTEGAPAEFDYGQLDAATSEFIIKAAGEIRRLGQQTIENVLTIGQHLIEVKARLGHGHFGPWLAAEFGWTDRTALRFMQCYEFVSSNPTPMSDLVRHLDPTGLYELAAPSTPESARQEVLDRVKQGGLVSTAEVKTIVRHYRVKVSAPIYTRPKHERAEPSSAKDEYEQRRTEAIGRLVERMRVIKNEYGPKAVQIAIDVYHQGDNFFPGS
jgi:hypothetical protein